MNFLTLPAGALTPLPPTVSKGVAPNWTPAPCSPGVEYAPNLKVDLFRHQGLYYYWVAGGWRVGQSPSGPWRSLKRSPGPSRAWIPSSSNPSTNREASRPINRNMVISISIIAAVDTIAVLSLFALALSRFPGNVTAAQTMAFTTPVSSELLRAYTSRSEQESLFSIGIFSNRWMVLATVSSFALLLLMLYAPLLQPFFDTVALSLADWLVMIPFICAASIAAELTKVYIRKRASATSGATV